MDSTNDNKFYVSVKGLFFNEKSELLMIKEPNGTWEIPGGRIQKGEQFIQTLKRECLEEIGLDCEVIDQTPLLVYPTMDREGRRRVMVYFRVDFKSLDFRPSEECIEIKFFNVHQIKNNPIYPQTVPLIDYLEGTVKQ